MVGSLGNLGKMLEQARTFQARLEETRARLQDIDVQGEAGAGLVSATVNCAGRLRTITIDPELEGEKREVLDDLIVAAVNDGLDKAEQRSRAELTESLGGMQLPPGLLETLQ